ncbi:MAG: hypothetical protein R3321_00405, partial [Nitrososphaeraceae archaeon]|nr:hypothetical protein [Nitrososphaeraceae archaeon]
RNSQPVYGKFFHLVSSIYCEDMDQLIWAYDSLKTEEGIMIRVCSPEGYLHGKRDKNLIKVKEFMQDEAIIIGFEPERYGKNLKIVPEELWGQPKNRAGKLIVRGLENSPFEGLEFKVGSGLSHEQREEIYDNYHDNWDNRIITFKYLRGGTKTLPRHPVFLGFREDI